MSGPARRLLQIIVGFCALGWALPATGRAAAAAPAPEGAQVLAIVNAQRAANGIPPITSEDQAYASSWCPDEDAPFQPGENGRVWASDNVWSAAATPYSTAPLHQQVIYSPLASVAGDVTVKGQDCMGVGEPGLEASLTSGAPPTFYAFVNERGPAHAVTSELADELPTTPQQEAGFPLDHRTGPQIIMWAEGLALDPMPGAVTLRTASGAVVSGVKVVAGDRDAILVPPVLRPGTSYRVQLEWRALGFAPETGLTVASTATQTVDFATQPAPTPPKRTRRRRRRG